MTTSQIKKVQAAAPTLTSATAVAGGGTFAAVAQYYVVTALGPWGESAPSTERTATPVLNGHIDLVIASPPAGSTGLRIYRGTGTGAENTLVMQLSGTLTGTITDPNTSLGSATPPAAAAFGNITKSGTMPTKANVPAGTPSGSAQALIEAMSDWCYGATATAAGVSPLAKIGKKVANGAGFDFQEV